MAKQTETKKTGVKFDTPQNARIVLGMENTNTARRTRRLNRTGCLISKGEGKPYLAKWTVEGKTFYKTTGESNYNKALRKLDEYTRGTRQDTREDMIAILEAQLAILKSKLAKPELALADLWDTFAATLDTENQTAGTISIKRAAVAALVEFFQRKGHNVSAVTVELADVFLKCQREKLGATTYNNRLVFYKLLWRTIASKGFNIVADAFEGQQKIKGVKNDSCRRALTQAEIDTLLTNAEPRARLLITIALHTGMRLSDCAMLKWSSLDMAHGLVSVVPIKTQRTGKAVIIPLARELKAELEKWERTGEYVCAENAAEYQNKRLDANMSRYFQRCGITTSEIINGKKRIVAGFHSLRHTFVSRAAEAGVTETTIAKIVGHSTVDMTRHYTHVSAEALKAEMAKLETTAA